MGLSPSSPSIKEVNLVLQVH